MTRIRTHNNRRRARELRKTDPWAMAFPPYRPTTDRRSGRTFISRYKNVSFEPTIMTLTKKEMEGFEILDWIEITPISLPNRDFKIGPECTENINPEWQGS